MSSRLQFVSNNGHEYPLDGSDGIFQVNLVDGLTTVPRDVLVEPRVSSDGGVLVNTRRGPRRVVLDVMIPDGDSMEVLARWGPLHAAFEAGGKLVFDGPNGVRELREVELEAPIHRVTGPDDIDDVWSTSLLAMDPWWYGPLVAQALPLVAPTGWDDPIGWDAVVPWNGGGSAIVTVEGDAPAWPIFMAAFGIDSLTVSNGIGSWSLATPLPGDLGQTDLVTVDHRPGVRGPHYGTEFFPSFPVKPLQFGLLTENSRVDWSLPPGPSTLVFGATGIAGTATLTMFSESRWLSP